MSTSVRSSPRIVLYSHDTMGLGHLRRNALLAHALARSAIQPTILSISGKGESAAFPLPPRSDRLILPALYKTQAGEYEPQSLVLSLDHTIAVRSQAILGAMTAFDPDLLIVDNVPRGARGELDDALRMLTLRGRTRCVLGLRDVLDNPSVVEHEWHKAGNEETIRRHYDEIWVYGDPALFDVGHAYQFSEAVIGKLQYTGYFDQRARLDFAPRDDGDVFDELGLPAGPLALCLIGGGQDGGDLARAFAAAELPVGWNGVVVTGPYLPHDELAPLRARAARDRRFRVLGMVTEPLRLIARADRVIAMGGYNSVWEILSCARPCLIVPRVRPRIEQLIRVERLAALGLVDALHPDSLSPARISNWLVEDLRPHRSVRDVVALKGLHNVSQLAAELLGPDRATVVGRYGRSRMAALG